MPSPSTDALKAALAATLKDMLAVGAAGVNGFLYDVASWLSAMLAGISTGASPEVIAELEAHAQARVEQLAAINLVSLEEKERRLYVGAALGVLRGVLVAMAS